jgi:hypothetical protein
VNPFSINPDTFHLDQKQVVTSIIPWVISLVFIIALAFLLRSDMFRLRQYTCTYLDQAPCPPQVTAEIDKQLGTSIFLFSPQNLRQKLLQAIPQTETIDITVSWPDSVDLTFTSSELLANLQSATNSASLTIAANRIIIDYQALPDTTLPVIISPAVASLRVGDKATDPALEYSLSLITTLKDHYIKAHILDSSDPTAIIVSLNDGFQAIFNHHRDLSRQVTSLQLILSKATIDPDLRIIDVRYDQPVLRHRSS